MLMVLEIAYQPAVSSKAPRKPFVSGGSAAIASSAPWTLAVLSPATGEMVITVGTFGSGTVAAHVADAGIVNDMVALRVRLGNQASAVAGKNPGAQVRRSGTGGTRQPSSQEASKAGSLKFLLRNKNPTFTNGEIAGTNKIFMINIRLECKSVIAQNRRFGTMAGMFLSLVCLNRKRQSARPQFELLHGITAPSNHPIPAANRPGYTGLRPSLTNWHCRWCRRGWTLKGRGLSRWQWTARWSHPGN